MLVVTRHSGGHVVFMLTDSGPGQDTYSISRQVGQTRSPNGVNRKREEEPQWLSVMRLKPQQNPGHQSLGVPEQAAS